MAVAVVFTVFLSLDGLFTPTVLNVKSDKPVADRIAEIVPQGQIYSYDVNEVKGNPMRKFTVNFYLGDRIVPFDVYMPTDGYLAANPEEVEAFVKENTDYQLNEMFDSGHRSCDDRKVLHLYQFRKAE